MLLFVFYLLSKGPLHKEAHWLLAVPFLCSMLNPSEPQLTLIYNTLYICIIYYGLYMFFLVGQKILNCSVFARFSTCNVHNSFDESILKVLVCPVSRKPLRWATEQGEQLTIFRIYILFAWFRPFLIIVWNRENQLMMSWSSF